MVDVISQFQQPGLQTFVSSLCPTPAPVCHKKGGCVCGDGGGGFFTGLSLVYFLFWPRGVQGGSVSPFICDSTALYHSGRRIQQIIAVFWLGYADWYKVTTNVEYALQQNILTAWTLNMICLTS